MFGSSLRASSHAATRSVSHPEPVQGRRVRHRFIRPRSADAGARQGVRDEVACSPTLTNAVMCGRGGPPIHRRALAGRSLCEGWSARRRCFHPQTRRVPFPSPECRKRCEPRRINVVRSVYKLNRTAVGEPGDDVQNYRQCTVARFLSFRACREIFSPEAQRA